MTNKGVYDSKFEMRKRLYISDVDFTLMGSDKKLSQFSENAINAFTRTGVNFTVATARSVHSLASLLGKVNFLLPIIEFNGGYITDYRSKQPLHKFSLDLDRVKTIRELGISHNIYPLISAFNSHQLVFPPPVSNEAYDAYFVERREMGDSRIQPLTPFDQIEKNDIMAVTFMGNYEKIFPLYQDIKEKMKEEVQIHYYENKYTPGTYWITIHDKYSSKENAIRKLMQIKDFEDTELVVFGDDVNDIGMMQFADRAIAVGNAKPEVQDVADEIIGSNDEDAVVKYILEEENLT